MTLGTQYAPRPGLLVRPEVRWDWHNSNGTLPFDNGTRQSLFTFALDTIVRY